MIYKEILLEQFDARIKSAVQAFHFGLGSSYDVSILYGKVSDEHFYLFDKQGGDLLAINKLRSSYHLHLLNPTTNVKVVKWEWGKGLISGKGIVFCVTRGNFRYKINDEIQNTINWFSVEFPQFEVDSVTNKRYSTIYLGLKNSA
jgi:hypothetical protein